MFKALIITTTFAAAAVPALAEAESTCELSILPAEVAARVIEMQKHGDRFEATIRAILVEAAKPSWTFDDGGPETDEIALAALPCRSDD